MKKLPDKVEYIRLGAIYRIGVRKVLKKATVIKLIVDRIGWKHEKAAAVVSHWWGSYPYRQARGEVL